MRLFRAEDQGHSEDAVVFVFGPAFDTRALHVRLDSDKMGDDEEHLDAAWLRLRFPPHPSTTTMK